MPKVRDIGNGMFEFYCPGCECNHTFYVNSPNWKKDSQGWTFNKDFNNPTFAPSLKNTWGKYADPNWQEPEGEDGKTLNLSGICHLFVQNGLINYCGDCTHQYNGKTGVAMKEF